MLSTYKRLRKSDTYRNCNNWKSYRKLSLEGKQTKIRAITLQGAVERSQILLQYLGN